MRVIVSAAVLLLAACNSQGPGTNISFDAKTDSGGTVKATADGKTGDVSIDAPGFKAAISLPKIQLDANDVDISGVELFPGSKISGMSIFAGDSKAKGSGNLRVAFDAPADVTTVQSWFDKEMKKHGFTLAAGSSGLTGTTVDGDPFSLELKPGASGHSNGVLAIEDKDKN